VLPVRTQIRRQDKSPDKSKVEIEMRNHSKSGAGSDDRKRFFR